MDCELIMLPESPHLARSQRRKECRGARPIAATILWQNKSALLVSEALLAVKMTIKRRVLAENLLCQTAKGSADPIHDQSEYRLRNDQSFLSSPM